MTGVKRTWSRGAALAARIVGLVYTAATPLQKEFARLSLPAWRLHVPQPRGVFLVDGTVPSSAVNLAHDAVGSCPARALQVAK